MELDAYLTALVLYPDTRVQEAHCLLRAFALLIVETISSLLGKIVKIETEDQHLEMDVAVSVDMRQDIPALFSCPTTQCVSQSVEMESE